MPFKKIKLKRKIKDEVFDLIYPTELQAVSAVHFTPVEVAKKAAQFLAPNGGERILDVGSGVGKFCMIGSVVTKGIFTGVEQRGHLHEYAKSIAAHHDLRNVHFVHANIMKIKFANFDAFYIFNPFFENLNESGKMDDSVVLKKGLYKKYSFYVHQQLDTKPIGTKLVTYYSFLTEIPDTYSVQSMDYDGRLKMWEKVSM